MFRDNMKQLLREMVIGKRNNQTRWECSGILENYNRIVLTIILSKEANERRQKSNDGSINLRHFTFCAALVMNPGGSYLSMRCIVYYLQNQNKLGENRVD